MGKFDNQYFVLSSEQYPQRLIIRLAIANSTLHYVFT